MPGTFCTCCVVLHIDLNDLKKLQIKISVRCFLARKLIHRNFQLAAAKISGQFESIFENGVTENSSQFVKRKKKCAILNHFRRIKFRIFQRKVDITEISSQADIATEQIFHRTDRAVPFNGFTFKNETDIASWGRCRTPVAIFLRAWAFSENPAR